MSCKIMKIRYCKVFVMINRGIYITITEMDAKCIPVEESEYGFRRR